MHPLLQLLETNARLSTEELALRTRASTEEAAAQIVEWEENGTILGYKTIVNREKAEQNLVRAIIEIKISPERGGGFDRLATRIAAFEQVKSCHLLSGSYDLAVVVEGIDLRDIARFVSEKLSTLSGVLSTATHFLLKTYKEDGFQSNSQEQRDRLPVTP